MNYITPTLLCSHISCGEELHTIKEKRGGRVVYVCSRGHTSIADKKTSMIGIS
jgi:hypothetical protein